MAAKNYEEARHTHTHTRDNHSIDNNKKYSFADAHMYNIIILYMCKTAHLALRVSKHVTESIRNIARGVSIN